MKKTIQASIIILSILFVLMLLGFSTCLQEKTINGITIYYFNLDNYLINIKQGEQIINNYFKNRFSNPYSNFTNGNFFTTIINSIIGVINTLIFLINIITMPYSMFTSLIPLVCAIGGFSLPSNITSFINSFGQATIPYLNYIN